MLPLSASSIIPPDTKISPSPVPSDEHEEMIDVLASGLHPRVRSQANGSHYTSTDELPLIPGIDGVGRRSDGSLVYFILPDTVYGAMAEHTVIDARRSIPLPPGADPILLAAAMNPGMSSWVALHQRVDLHARAVGLDTRCHRLGRAARHSDRQASRGERSLCGRTGSGQAGGTGPGSVLTTPSISPPTPTWSHTTWRRRQPRLMWFSTISGANLPNQRSCPC